MIKTAMLVFTTALLLTGASGVRSVEGFVSEPNGRAVANAVVKLEDPRTLRIRSYRTNKLGAYHFAGLSTNQDYKLKASFRKRSSGDWKWLSRFDSGDPARLDLQLR